MKRLIAVLIAGVLCASTLAAQVGFAGLDLAENHRLLFQAGAESPRYGSYQTLFLADVEEASLQQLTFFPEELVLVSGGAGVQIHNRYGVFRGQEPSGELEPVPLLPSFARDGRLEHGTPSPLRVSPDGRYVLRVRPESAAFGVLELIDLEAMQQTLVSRDIEIDLAEPPCAWSPSSDFFVYAKAGTLYYFSIRQLGEGRLLAQDYRRIGEGRIQNVRWGEGGSLYYLKGSLLYRLNTRELFTRALYSGYLPIGELSGKIPFDFDPSFDRFWVSPAGDRILLNKNGRNLFVYPLQSEDFASTDQGYALPYLYLPRSRAVKRVLWSDSGALTILTEGLENGVLQTTVYRQQDPETGSPSAFAKLPDQPRDLVLSPDRSTVAAVLADRVRLIDLKSWKAGAARAHFDPLHVLWSEDGGLVIAGRRVIERWDPQSGEARLIAISQAGSYSFSGDEQAVLMHLGDESWRRELGRPGWRPGGPLPAALREKRIASGAYRVYLEEALADPFRNVIMIRDARGFGTRPLLAPGEPEFEPFPAAEDPPEVEVFAHGVRTRRREVALVFNAIDSIEGLPGILSTLNRYKIRATFFVNGEVIRRHPDAVREIGEAGHEVGSLFYFYFNMTDSRFRVDKEFIKRGLARNEDEYHAATGRELSLLWHAPYYFVSSPALEASREMNYIYVSRDVEPLDWVTREMSFTAQDLYLPSARLVERIMSLKKPGSIIPIRVGTPGGGREDYLFQKLDLLIDGLLKRGYRVVPVTTLMEHAR